jgi:rhamnose utilization protein RhaD (predicted bifunctional aldolase and dehydrogenase)
MSQSAWVTVGWDHFIPTPYYFSDRLPIALASGVAHVTSFQPGYEAMFPPEHGLFWADSIHEAVDTVTWLLEQPREYLLDQGANAAELARSRLNQHSQIVDLIGDMSTLRSQLQTKPDRRKRSERSR